MSASHRRWACRLIAAIAITASIVGAGCASQRAAQPKVPDQSLLDPATEALDKAVSAHADEFAPRIVDSARRRTTVARDILFKAAEDDHALTDAETSRVQTLVEQARLDAKAALTKTQAGAIRKKMDQLKDVGGNGQNEVASGPATNNAGTDDDGLGSGAPSSGRGSNPPGGLQ